MYKLLQTINNIKFILNWKKNIYNVFKILKYFEKYLKNVKKI